MSISHSKIQDDLHMMQLSLLLCILHHRATEWSTDDFFREGTIAQDNPSPDEYFACWVAKACNFSCAYSPFPSNVPQQEAEKCTSWVEEAIYDIAPKGSGTCWSKEWLLKNVQPSGSNTVQSLARWTSPLLGTTGVEVPDC